MECLNVWMCVKSSAAFCWAQQRTERGSNVVRWMRGLAGRSCAVELLWWSRVSSLGQQMADWFPQHRDGATLTGERLTQRRLWRRKCVSPYSLRLYICAAYGIFSIKCVRVHKICKFAVIVHSQFKCVNSLHRPTQLHLFCCFVPSGCLGYKFWTRCTKNCF